MWNWLRRWVVGNPQAPLIVVTRRGGPQDTAEEIYGKVDLWLKGLSPCLIVSDGVTVEVIPTK